MAEPRPLLLPAMLVVAITGLIAIGIVRSVPNIGSPAGSAVVTFDAGKNVPTVPIFPGQPTP